MMRNRHTARKQWTVRHSPVRHRALFKGTAAISGMGQLIMAAGLLTAATSGMGQLITAAGLQPALTLTC